MRRLVVDILSLCEPDFYAAPLGKPQRCIGNSDRPARSKEIRICREAAGQFRSRPKFDGPIDRSLEIVFRIRNEIMEVDLILVTIRPDHPGFDLVDNETILRIVTGGIPGRWRTPRCARPL